ncbi:MAG: SDR family NAD(P)-dependent oxidoreductase [Phycisphaeraceae bacterium]
MPDVQPEPVQTEPRAPLAIVTGASSGIGKAVAILLAQRGVRTILIARRTDRLEALAKELSAKVPSFPLTLDLLDNLAIDQALNRIIADYGHVDILINNAGDGKMLKALEHSHEEHHRMMQVHYFAPVKFIEKLLPGMLARGKGHIINVSSLSSKMGPWGHGPYSAAKAAIVSFTQTLAMEYCNCGVHFSYVNPGLVLTEFFDNPGYDKLQDEVKKRGIPAQRVAKKIVRLLDRPKLELCVPRLYRIIDLFKAISPTFAHWVVKKGSTPKDERK